MQAKLFNKRAVASVIHTLAGIWSCKRFKKNLQPYAMENGLILYFPCALNVMLVLISSGKCLK
jgi:hypothetical protein